MNSAGIAIGYASITISNEEAQLSLSVLERQREILADQAARPVRIFWHPDAALNVAADLFGREPFSPKSHQIIDPNLIRHHVFLARFVTQGAGALVSSGFSHFIVRVH
jgi:hypothetical protein